MTREEAIENLKYAIRWNDMPVKEAMEMAIKALSSSEQPNRWIPVKDKLPAMCTHVWATCRSLKDDRENWVIDTCYVPLPKEANRKYSDWGNIPMLNWGQAEVIAWMEQDIPEPYEPQERNDEG